MKHISERLLALNKLRPDISKHLPQMIDIVDGEIEKENLFILKRNAIRRRKQIIGK